MTPCQDIVKALQPFSMAQEIWNHGKNEFHLLSTKSAHRRVLLVSNGFY